MIEKIPDCSQLNFSITFNDESGAKEDCDNQHFDHIMSDSARSGKFVVEQDPNGQFNVNAFGIPVMPPMADPSSQSSAWLEPPSQPIGGMPEIMPPQAMQPQVPSLVGLPTG